MTTGISDGFAVVEGLRLHYVASGQAGKPLLLFLHGFPEHCRAWDRQLVELSRSHYAVALDLPGCNRSGKPQDLASYRAGPVAKLVYAFVGSLGYKRCAIVGHDWGGAIGWYLAATCPEMLESFVAINAVHPAVFTRELSSNSAQRAASRYFDLFCRSDAEAMLSENDFAYLRTMLESEPGRRPEWFDEAAEATYLAAWSEPGSLTGGLNYYRASGAVKRTQDQMAVAGSTTRKRDSSLVVRVPTLVIWGVEDKFLLTGNLEGLGEYVPQLRIERIAGASHWVAHEQPELVNRLIAGFLENGERRMATGAASQ